MASKKEATLLLKIKETGSKALTRIKNGLGALKTAAKVASVAMVGFIIASVKAFDTQDKAVRSVEQSLKTQGLEVEKLSKKYQKLASAIQKQSTFGDEQILQGMALLQNFIGQEEITASLTKGIVDFAAAMQVDLKTAFTLVGKSIGSSTNALTRYGIEIDTSSTKQQKMVDITQSLNEKFAGQAKVQAENLGAVTQLKNSFGDLMEVIGKKFAPKIVEIAKIMNKWVTDPNTERYLENLEQGLIDVGKVLGKLIKITSQFTRTLSTGLAGTIESVTQAANGNFKGMLDVTKKTYKEMWGIITEEGPKKRADEINKKYLEEDVRRRLEAGEEILWSEIEIADKILLENERVDKLINEVKLANRKKALAELEAIEVTATKATMARFRKNQDALRAMKDYEVKLEKETQSKVSETKEEKSDLSNINILGGFEKLSDNMLAVAVDKFVPGFGKIASEIFRLLSQGSEEFEESLDQLFNTEFLDNIANNIETLFDRLPILLENAVEGIVRAVPKIVSTIQRELTKPSTQIAISRAIVEGFVDGLKDAFDTVLRDVGETIKDVFTGKFIVDGIKSIFKKSDPLIKGLTSKQQQELRELEERESEILKELKILKLEETLDELNKREDEASKETQQIQKELNNAIETLAEQRKDKQISILKDRIQIEERKLNEAIKTRETLENELDALINRKEELRRKKIENLQNIEKDKKQTALEKSLKDEQALLDRSNSDVIKIENEISDIKFALRKNITEEEKAQLETSLQELQDKLTPALSLRNEIEKELDEEKLVEKQRIGIKEEETLDQKYANEISALMENIETVKFQLSKAHEDEETLLNTFNKSKLELIDIQNQDEQKITEDHIKDLESSLTDARDMELKIKEEIKDESIKLRKEQVTEEKRLLNELAGIQSTLGIRKTEVGQGSAGGPTVSFISSGEISDIEKQLNPFPAADGGLFKARPGGTLARIGEGGEDEIVAPLSKLSQIMNMSNNISIVVQGGLLGDESSARELAIAIDNELLKLRQNNESVSFDQGVT